MAGGLRYPSGAFIFFTALISGILGFWAKVFYAEPGDSNLRAPTTTLLTYCAGMAVMGCVAAFVRRLRPTVGLLPRVPVEGGAMRRAAAGALVLGMGLQLLTFGGIREEGSLVSALRQMNFFVVMSIVLGTFSEVKRTGGQRGTNWVVWTGILWNQAFGLIGFSKEGILSPPVTWFITAVVAGYSFSRKQLLGGIVCIILFQTYIIPFTQYGRNFRSEDYNAWEDAKMAIRLLADLRGTRAIYETAVKDPDHDYGDVPHYFDRSHGLVDRLTMLAPDDALTAYTLEGNTAGYLPTIAGLVNIIPHFIWKDKPFYYVGNRYAREVGIISEDNDATGISFSPTADAFHQKRWQGIFLLLPAVLLCLFLIMDFMSGDLRESPWGVFFAVGCSHVAPEGMIGGQIYFATYGVFGITVIAIMARYVLPLVAGIFTSNPGPGPVRTPHFSPRPLSRSAAPAPAEPLPHPRNA